MAREAGCIPSKYKRLNRTVVFRRGCPRFLIKSRATTPVGYSEPYRSNARTPTPSAYAARTASCNRTDRFDFDGAGFRDGDHFRHSRRTASPGRQTPAQELCRGQVSREGDPRGQAKDAVRHEEEYRRQRARLVRFVRRPTRNHALSERQTPRFAVRPLSSLLQRTFKEEADPAAAGKRLPSCPEETPGCALNNAGSPTASRN